MYVHDFHKKVLLKNNVRFHLSVAAGGGCYMSGIFFYLGSKWQMHKGN